MKPLYGIAVLLALCLFGAARAAATPAGGTTIVNAASATYADAASHRYQSASNPLVVTVTSLSAITVSPKESAPDGSSDLTAVGSSTVRTFTVTNTSNITDAYQISSLGAGTLKISNVAWMTASGPQNTAVNGATSPAVEPGASIVLRVTISTAALTVGESVAVKLLAHTTATGTGNGLASDTGQQWIVGTTGASLTGAGGPNTAVTKTVNQTTMVQSEPGSTVQFSIVAKNSGGAPATGVVVSDPVPEGLAVDLSSATIDGQPAGTQATLSGQTIRFAIPMLAPGAMLQVSFRASLPPGQTLGQTFVNVATISADGIAPQTTTPAAVLVGSANIVFDGYSGASHPIAGATVSLLGANGKPLDLTGLNAAAVKARTDAIATINMTNPYVTGADGTYGFGLSPSSIPATGATFYLTISAPGYLNRKIELQLTPATSNFYYNVIQTSLDKQPLAIAGGFTLTRTNVNIHDLFGLFGNLPLFTQSSIVVSKNVDKQAASPGDRLLFTVTYDDQTSVTFTNVSIVDTLPAGMVYLRDTARVDGSPQEPIVNGRTLTWTQATLVPGDAHTITYAATIFGGVAAGTVLTNTVTASAGTSGGAVSASGSSSASVTVLDGPFSTRRVVTGRVFVDDAHRGYFVKGDRALAGVRVVMEDGSYAITDSLGMFSFPSVRPGMHALRLDPLTLPDNVVHRSTAPMNSNRSMERLLHGILDDGTMEDVQFAVEPK